MKRKLRVFLGGMALLLVLTGLWAFAIEPRLLIVRQQRIALAGWPQDVRVAVLFDLHVGSTGVPIAQLRKIVAWTNGERPDLIVLLGDYVIGGPRGNQESLRRHFVPPEATAAELEHLHAPLGVFAVLGNHDWWFDGERTRRALEGAKIPVLENQAVRIDFNNRGVNNRGGHFWLGGIADLWTRNPDVAGTLRQVSDSEPVVLITHNPDIFPEVPIA